MDSQRVGVLAVSDQGCLGVIDESPAGLALVAFPPGTDWEADRVLALPTDDGGTLSVTVGESVGLAGGFMSASTLDEDGALTAACGGGIDEVFVSWGARSG
ncbi:hypothetical protein [Salana multivorans]